MLGTAQPRQVCTTKSVYKSQRKNYRPWGGNSGPLSQILEVEVKGCGRLACGSLVPHVCRWSKREANI
jgi:hypothetical protein